MALISFGSAKNSMKKRREYYSSLTEILNQLKFHTIIVDEKVAKNTHATFVEYLPFDKVIGFFDVVIHHGGIGTAMQCITNNVPQVIVPRMLDQFFWAEQLSRLGLAYNLRKMDKLVEVVQENSLNSMRNAAERYSVNRKKTDMMRACAGMFD